MVAKNALPAEEKLAGVDSKRLVVAHAATSEVSVERWQGGVLVSALDHVAEEVPIAMIYNGISHVVMLATPADLTDFALGFSLSEGLLSDKSDLYGVEAIEGTQGIELQMDVATESFVQLKQHRRNMTGRTGCGLCGAESLAQALRLPAQPINHHALKISASSIELAFKTMNAHQPLQQITGATHACAWVSVTGEIQAVREDVGRHNAMDKLIGALARVSAQKNGFVLTSSRASVEMVQKVATAGIGILVAISAPTGLAVRVAEAYGVTLIGFMRNHQFVIYTHPYRIQCEQS